MEKKEGYELYSQVGEWLKINRSLSVPERFKNFVDVKKNIADNIEHLFNKSKLLKRKLEESKLRLIELEAEIKKIELSDDVVEAPSRKTSKPLKKKKTANYRTLILDETFEAYLGKSAKDNLTLLREAQPWDLWMHLRDQPGAHVIIRRPKNRDVPESLINKTVQWLVHETASKRFVKGDIVEVQMQEVRYVRPIKGDSPGRVSVQNPKHRRVRITS